MRFANGVRLLLKRTDFAADEVRVRVRVGTGRLGVTAAQAPGLWQVNGVAPLLRLGGTRELTYEDIERLTVGNRVGLSQSLEDDAFQLDGNTTQSDFDRQLQLLQATITSPGLRTAAFERVRGALLNQLPQVEATASGMLGRAFGPALHGGDRRWQGRPDGPTLAQAGPGDLAGLIGPAFAGGPIELVVVGDIDPARVIDAAARSFGALPTRAPRQPPGPAAEGVRFPAPGTPPLIVPHAGRADQAMALLAWPTTDFFADPQGQRVLATMAEILQTRLTDRLRTADGVTYSPQVGAVSSDVFIGVGHVYAVVETPVDKIDVFYTALDELVHAMQAAPADEDELQRAKRPRIDARRKRLRENSYWLSALSSAQGDRRHFDAIRELVSGSEKVTAAEVQAAARKYLVGERAFRLIVRPKG